MPFNFSHRNHLPSSASLLQMNHLRSCAEGGEYDDEDHLRSCAEGVEYDDELWADADINDLYTRLVDHAPRRVWLELNGDPEGICFAPWLCVSSILRIRPERLRAILGDCWNSMKVERSLCPCISRRRQGHPDSLSRKVSYASEGSKFWRGQQG